MRPPADTVALNPYTRPKSSVRPGEVPQGAQRLSAVRQAPGGGRDLYASPDGSVYRRKNDGWYRRQSGGGWDFYAPLQGAEAGKQSAGARSAQKAGPAGATPGRGTIAGRARVPDSGVQARAQEVAALERLNRF